MKYIKRINFIAMIFILLLLISCEPFDPYWAAGANTREREFLFDDFNEYTDLTNSKWIVDPPLTWILMEDPPASGEKYAEIMTSGEGFYILELNESIDLSDSMNTQIMFWTEFIISPPSVILLQYSTDGGSNWQDLELTWDQNDITHDPYEFDGIQDLRLRFFFDCQNPAAEEWRIDDVSIIGQVQEER